MTEQGVQLYLSPLQIEANFFLNSLDECAKTCPQLDDRLLATLELVVAAIEKFVDQKQPKIVPTEITKFVDRAELDNVHRIFHCSKCRMDLGRNLDKAAVHLMDQHVGKSRKMTRKEKRKEEAAKRSNIIIKLPKKVASFISSSDLDAFFNNQLQVAETLKHIPQYETIEKDLLTLMTPLFPNQSIRLYKFGSRISGVGTASSDLDIFADIGNTFNTFENRASRQTLSNLTKVFDALGKNKKVWHYLLKISNARVPIIRAIHNSTQIECDIGFSNSLGFCNTILMEYLFDLQPIARRMCFFLKRWLERSKLSEHISSYSMSLLVVFYLQTKMLLPAVLQLQPPDLKATVCVGPWIGNFLQKSLLELELPKISCTKAICLRHVHDFFVYYAEFDFAQYAVCPFIGRRLKISQFLADMPERYTNFVKEIDPSVKDRGLELNKPMVVQDPIQLNHNVTKAISALLMKQLGEYFHQSILLLAD